MAKDTIGAIKEAEKLANQTIALSKEECAKLINDASEQKLALLKEAKSEILAENDEIVAQAQAKSEELKVENISAVAQTLSGLDVQYDTKKSETIAELINVVLA